MATGPSRACAPCCVTRGSLGVVKDSVCYMSNLFLLFDLLAFDDEWAARVASGARARRASRPPAATLTATVAATTLTT